MEGVSVEEMQERVLKALGYKLPAEEKVCG